MSSIRKGASYKTHDGEKRERERESTDLPDDALDEFVHSEGDVGVDGEHLSQRVLILRRLHVTVQ